MISFLPIRFLLLTISALFYFQAIAQPGRISGDVAGLTDVYQEKKWVDSVMNSLSPDERISQLFMIRTYSNKDRRYYDSISQLIMKYNLGGLTFFQGSPVRQAELINYWQNLAKTPIMISIDAEWGLAMRLDSVTAFPKHMTLGAVQDDEIVYKSGYHIGLQCKRAGIQMNFAPVTDINSNPKNPVINFRSFGEVKENVGAKGAAFIRGMQDAGVIATAKHFPGHGDTDTDSHYTLPVLNHSRAVIDSIDLFPFKQAIAAKTGAIMIAHLFIPTIDDTKDRATSLSEKAVNGILKSELGFEGLVVTDALDMDGVTNYHKSGDIELMALLAGNDILLLPRNIPLALKKIREAVTAGKISQDEIDDRCRKVLTYKYRTGLSQRKPVELRNLTSDLNCAANDWVIRQVFENAVTVVKNDAELIPLTSLDTLRIATLAIGSSKTSPFQSRIGSYAVADHFYLPSDPGKSQVAEILKQLESYNLVIVSIENTSSFLKRNYGITTSVIELIKQLKSQQGKLILDVFGNPYSLSYFADHQGIDAFICSYEDNAVSKDVSAQIIFGAIGAKGRLPVSASSSMPAGSGVDTRSVGRLKYTVPEELGISTKRLDTIGKLIENGIKQGAYPGCQVLFAKDGKVFYERSFGFHAYDKNRPVQSDDLYDLASLTKILAATPAMMQLVEKGEIDPDQPLSDHLDYLKNSNKQNRSIREIMAHKAQFQSWIPFYRATLKDGQPNPEIYSKTRSELFNEQVAKDLYIANRYRQAIFDTIVKSKLLPKKEYKYSDLGFILIGDAIERKTGKPLFEYLSSSFYRPMGLATLGYKPAERFPLERITPTELDNEFRKQLVHGFVHDPAAAMLGGVAGHAGLFGRSADVAAMMQLFIQKGYYGGRQYIDPKIVDEFTRQQFPLDQNRRGMGFDKPLPVYSQQGPVCRNASLESYGHSGFTGTYAWADPKNGLIYVFLSNRIHPDASNRKLTQMDLRTKIHQVMYEILNETDNSVLNKPK